MPDAGEAHSDGKVMPVKLLRAATLTPKAVAMAATLARKMVRARTGNTPST